MTPFWEAVQTATDPVAYKPERNTAVTIARLSNREEPYYVLKEPKRKTYLRLSEEDYALWWQMNGRNRVKDLLFYSLKRYKSLPVGHLNNVIGEMRQGGFLQDTPANIYDQISSQLNARAPESRGRRLLRGFLHTEIARDGLDPFFTNLYRWTRPLFSRFGQLLLFLIVLSGGGLFAMLYGRQAYTMTGSGFVGALTLIIANLLVIGIHELAHGLAVKQIGRELDRGGFLLYWGLPAFFVDTRDTWMSSSRDRILVSWAGPYSGLILGGLVSWLLTAVALFIPQISDRLIATFLYQVSFLAYLSVIINLNPLLELDGYFILMDWLEMPGLRARAFRFWRQQFWPKFKATTTPRRFWQELNATERIFTFFGALAFLYSIFALWLALNFWHSRLAPFAQSLWARGFWGRLLLVLLTAVILIPTLYYLTLLLWNRIQAAIRWLAHRDLLARPDVLTLLTGLPIIIGLPLIWFGLGRLPAGNIWRPMFIWLLYLLVTVQLGSIARQLPGSRFQWAVWALAAAPLALSLSWLAEDATFYYDLSLMAASATILASGIVAWFTINPKWMVRSDRLALAAFTLIGIGMFAIQMQIGGEALRENGRWLAAAFITSCTYFGLALMAPLLLNFFRSRFALPWGILVLAMGLTPWLLLFPRLQIPVLALWLFAISLYLLLGLLAQFGRYEADYEQTAAFSERERLINGFNHFMAALFTSYEAVFGGRRLGAIQVEIRSLGLLDPDLSILQIGEQARHALLVAVDRLDDLAGTPFTRKAGQAAYDSLPWLEAETLARHVLAHTQWGAGLAQGFILARDHRRELIRQADVFAGLDRDGVAEVAAAMQTQTVRKGGMMARHGREATHFFIVDTGEVTVLHNEQQVATLSRGAAFGTNALAGEGDYSFSYQAVSAVTLLTLHRDDFDPLLRADTTLARQVSSGVQERNLLRRMPLFSSLSPQELATIDASLQKKRIPAGTTFIQQGDARSHLFIIAQGAVELFITTSGQEEVVGRLGSGEHFGEYALFADMPYSASGRATLDTELLLLDEPRFDALVVKYDRMTHYVEQLGSGRLLVTQRHTPLPS
ncbi:MAG: cyclic nucleotide-binding domain-containing protein [Chloroflexi bacterium]|nr:cyclic nucleotide-binding domain-containing protein [Chloroflexota bacterium]